MLRLDVRVVLTDGANWYAVSTTKSIFPCCFYRKTLYSRLHFVSANLLILSYFQDSPSMLFPVFLPFPTNSITGRDCWHSGTCFECCRLFSGVIVRPHEELLNVFKEHNLYSMNWEQENGADEYRSSLEKKVVEVMRRLLARARDATLQSLKDHGWATSFTEGTFWPLESSSNWTDGFRLSKSKSYFLHLFEERGWPWRN